MKIQKIQKVLLENGQKKVLDLTNDTFLAFLVDFPLNPPIVENSLKNEISPIFVFEITINLKKPNIKVLAVQKEILEEKKCEFVININHEAPKTISRFKSRLVLRKGAKVGFYGSIRLGPEADWADGDLDAKALLAGENLFWEALPGLDIENKTAVARHRASSAGFDESLVSYLKSRGFGPKEARKILEESFLREAEGLFYN